MQLKKKKKIKGNLVQNPPVYIATFSCWLDSVHVYYVGFRIRVRLVSKANSLAVCQLVALIEDRVLFVSVSFSIVGSISILPFCSSAPLAFIEEEKPTIVFLTAHMIYTVINGSICNDRRQGAFAFMHTTAVGLLAIQHHLFSCRPSSPT